MRWDTCISEEYKILWIDKIAYPSLFAECVELNCKDSFLISREDYLYLSFLSGEGIFFSEIVGEGEGELQKTV